MMKEMIKYNEEILERKVNSKEKEILKIAVLDRENDLNKVSDKLLERLIKIHNELSKDIGEGFIDGDTVDGEYCSRETIVQVLDFESLGSDLDITLNYIKQTRLAIQKELKN